MFAMLLWFHVDTRMTVFESKIDSMDDKIDLLRADMTAGTASRYTAVDAAMNWGALYTFNIDRIPGFRVPDVFKTREHGSMVFIGDK